MLGVKVQGRYVVDETVDLEVEVLNAMTEQLTLADQVLKHFRQEQIPHMGLLADLLQVQTIIQVPVAEVQDK
jgi:hypothetical protein